MRNLGSCMSLTIESAKMMFERISWGFGEGVELVVPDVLSVPNIVLEPPGSGTEGGRKMSSEI
jgi:hypothetical protein